MKKLFPFLFFLPVAALLHAQTSVIVADTSSEPDMRAAKILQQYLGEITGKPVDLLPFAKGAANAGTVIIGYHPSLEKSGFPAPPPLPEDAFFIQGKKGRFFIAGGGEMGAEYGAYDLLERLGCRKYSPRVTYIPKVRKLRLPEVPPTIEKPAFPYRELWYEPAFDEGWARWHRLKTNSEKNTEWGLFVHTFDKLCPKEEYFTEHPEYYSWNGARYSPGQLCLSNDTVRQIVVSNLRKMIGERPEAKYWSVSQNDNFDYCKCSRCAASDARYGSPAGTLLAFVNAVAAEFPEKTISTLAYQYTRKAPTGIRPANNVSICLCSIECNRGLPIEAGCADFARDLEEWSQLTGNLMIWDYVVQFRSYVSPFPNWHTLQPNLQLFQRFGVRMVFEQGSGHNRSEFSGMRAYLLAKLMWNPRVDMDSLLMDFGEGYYGPARPFIWDYIHQLTTSLAASDRWLGIYGTPQMEANSFLTVQNLKDYRAILDSATAVVTQEPWSTRLEEAKLPLQYAVLELAKIRDEYIEPAEKMLPGFVEALKRTGHLYLHEMGYGADQYEADYRKFLKEGRVSHRFMQKDGVSTELAQPASVKYENGNAGILTDGRRGTDDYHFNWLGFEGTDLVATLALPGNELPEVSSVSVQFLQDQQSWVFFPEKVTIEISEDGQQFRQVHEENIDIVPDGKKAVRRVEAVFEPAKVRAVRVSAVNRKTCPPWHSCVGNPCWIFADEIVIK